MSPTYSCSCGRVISIYSIANHLKSKTHLELVGLKKELESVRNCNNDLKKIIQLKSGAFN